MQAHHVSRFAFPVLVMVGSLGCSGESARPGSSGLSGGRAAPSANGTEGKKPVQAKIVTLPELMKQIDRHRGKVLVVDFWALW